MTKLVLVLAVVVVVILVVVIVAVRNMRAEDPDEFADQGDGRGRVRDNRDDRDPRLSPPGIRRPSASPRWARCTARRRPAIGALSGRAPGNGTRSRRREPRLPAGADPEDGRTTTTRRGLRSSVAGGPTTIAAARRSRPGRTNAAVPKAACSTGRKARRPPGTRRRSGDSSEWDSSEWEQLSDVDYWTELASSKPMTAGAQPAKRGGAAAGPGQDLEPETLAVRTPAPGGVPRRDPVTGLPVRGPEPADAELAAAAGRTDFVPAPVPVAGTQERQRPQAASNGDRGSRHHRRPPAARTATGARAAASCLPPRRSAIPASVSSTPRAGTPAVTWMSARRACRCRRSATSRMPRPRRGPGRQAQGHPGGPARRSRPACGAGSARPQESAPRSPRR